MIREVFGAMGGKVRLRGILQLPRVREPGGAVLPIVDLN